MTGATLAIKPCNSRDNCHVLELHVNSKADYFFSKCMCSQCIGDFKLTAQAWQLQDVADLKRHEQQRVTLSVTNQLDWRSSRFWRCRTTKNRRESREHCFPQHIPSLISRRSLPMQQVVRYRNLDMSTFHFHSWTE